MPARTKRQPKLKTTGGFTKVSSMPPAKRRRRDSWLAMIGAKSWDELLDGAAYKIEIPKVDDQEEAMIDFMRSVRAALRYRNVKSGTAKSLITHREGDRIVHLQVVDR